MDGIQGILAPEAEIGNAAGSGADNALQSMEFIGMDQSLSTQAATGGINAAKTLFSKKVWKIKVSLKNDFPVLLKHNELKSKMMENQKRPVLLVVKQREEYQKQIEQAVPPEAAGEKAVRLRQPTHLMKARIGNKLIFLT